MPLFKVFILILAGAVLALGACAVFIVTLFEAPKLVAAWMPGWAADKIGRQGVALLGGTAPACNEGKGAAAIGRILGRLQGAAHYGRPFTLHLAKGEHENAFSLPGRHIVLVTALLKRAETPEEIAGVLAHEMGHGLEGDPEALFLRNIGLKAILKFTAWGDESRAAFSAMLAQLRYTREAEVRADAHAIGILRRARVPARAAGEFILRSAAESPTGENVLDDFGAHLRPSERAKPFLFEPPYDAEPILGEEEWAAAKAICGGKGGEDLSRAPP